MKGKEEEEKEETTVKPGEKVPDSGIYENECGDRTTLIEDKPAPPTPKPGQTWTQVVDTNPKKQ